jgi:hypothetical protein
MAGARRHAREEEESELGRERKRRKREGGRRGVFLESPGDHLGLKAASRRWHSGDPAQDTQACCLLEEEERDFCREPPRFLEDFWTELKRRVLQASVIQMESRISEIWQGLFRKIVEAPQILFANFWVHLNANSNRDICTC